MIIFIVRYIYYDLLFFVIINGKKHGGEGKKEAVLLHENFFHLWVIGQKDPNSNYDVHKIKSVVQRIYASNELYRNCSVVLRFNAIYLNWILNY